MEETLWDAFTAIVHAYFPRWRAAPPAPSPPWYFINMLD